ncbi:uncharacterized protein LOC113215308 [Frankliniella occidentalis]|uniref:Uncharacterized protein LOC113215308 n=1 Tax=Frankliniella occidentalis TaxID=133901 RepID=A0A6J1TIP4_FRAOC|nr:uncharacterized protein LOC113215308 [Frankliniella occidentalis]
MQVWKDTEDKINLLYYPTHSHHCSPSDLVHQPLSKKDDMYINEKIAWGVSPTKILRDIQKNCIPTTSSLDQIQNFKAAVKTKKRIRERARKRREKRRYHKDEAKAVFLMVNELSKDRDCVVLYKPYGHDVQIGPKEINSLPDHKQLFMLGLQTKEQAALMVEHSHKIVLVDETHGTNHHKYQLLTLMIIDDNNRGWPVAHLISSKSDADTLQYFFRALKEKHGNADNLNLNCIISDDDSALINAMDLGFEGKLGSLRHILCKWHLLRAFKKNLRSHVPKSFVDTMMNELRVLVNETDQKTFYDLQAGFIAKYENLDQCKSFITEYYRKYYVDRVTKWAMCFRNFPHANINTTGHIESFHHRLKKVYLKRKVNRRLDDLVNILIDIEWDDKIRRVRESVVGMAYQPHEILDRHKRGMQISDEDLVKIDENTWDIKSSSGKDNYYIARYHEKCPLDHCFLKCTQILCGGLCSHIYSCSCKDTNPLCKHVHKLHSLLMRDIVKQVRDNACNVDFVPDEPCNEEAFHIPKSTPPENRRTLSHQFVELEENLSQLAEILSSAKGNQRPLKNANAIDHATTVTRELILQLKYMCEDDDVDEVPFMEPAVKFNSNEKLKTQVSQLLPFKKPAAKRKRKEAGVSPERKKAIKKDLLGILDSDNPDDPGSSSEPLGFIPSDDPGRSSKSLTSFTPPLSFAPNPCDVILKCGYEQISLLALKSLEYQMSDEEKQECRMLDPAFTCGWLYSSVINAYLNSLEDQYPLCLALSSDLAIRASRGQSNLRVLQKSFADSQKDVVLLPCNLSGYHWCIIAVHLTTPKILYYDPLQGELSQPTQTLLFQLSKDLNSLLPLNSGWKTIVYVKAVKQDDSYNCGVYACAFAEQMARKSLPFQKPTNINAFRKKIYDSIVGGCLRDMNLEQCSICYEDFSQQFENDNRTWISCKRCDKWFHDDCVTNSTVHFVCPS